MRNKGLIFVLVGILTHSLVAPQSSPADLQVYLLVLKDPSVIEKVREWDSGSALAQRRAVLSSPEAHRYQGQIEQQSLRFLELLDGQPVEILDRRTYLLNLAVVRASPDQVAGLEEDERVKAVYPNRVYYPALDSAPFLVGAPFLWDALGGSGQAGLGMKIGIIDSGINTEHPMFSGKNLEVPAGFPLGDIDFTNQKIIVARNYVLPEFGLRDQSEKNPTDELGHGSQVAGVAAGGAVETPVGIIQGFAPAAFLGNYRVFGSPSVNPTTTSAAIIAAIEEAIQDGMDVLNLSLGGPSKTSPDDPEQQAIRLAVEAGVVVVVAAGNAGPDPGTVTSPGTSPDAITVGATSNGRVFASGLQITADIPVPPEIRSLPYVAGTGDPIEDTLGPLPLVSVVSADPSELACVPFPEDGFSEQVVLVRRGECLFSVKAANLFQTGAAGMVVYNNIEGSAVVMSGLDGIPQPAVMIEKDAGEQLRDFLQASVAQITFGPAGEESPFPSQPHRITEFSGRGPSLDLNIKPDLVSPGENIHTATRELEPEQRFNRAASGTSFATPMVAGAAALIKQLRPEWIDQLPSRDLARAIKSVLVNTASKETLWGGQAAGVMLTGNGRLDLLQAMQVQAALYPVSLSFGLTGEDVSDRLEQRVELSNLDSRPQTFRIEVMPLLENPTVEIFTTPREMSLSPGQTGEFMVNVDLVSPLTGGVFEGFLQVKAEEGTTELTAAYWGAVTVEDSSVTLRVAQDDPFAYASLTSAVADAQPGNVIRIEDDGVYPEVLDLHYNSDGLVLNGLTITGASGLHPTLDARQVGNSSAAITVSDLERVTVQGLRIKGGMHAISYQDSSGVIRDNIVDGTSGSQASHGIEVANSRVHLHGNLIQGSQGRAIALFGSDALIQGNQLGGSQPGEGSRGGGIYAPSGGKLGIFDNHMDNNGGSGFSDSGIYLSGLEAVVRGNWIQNGPGGSAHGIFVRGNNTRVVLMDNQIQGNGGHGVLVEDGAETVFHRSVIRGNEGAGIRLEGASRVEVYSSQLLDNQRGIQSLSSELVLSDSLVARSRHPSEGDGIWAMGGDLRVSNSTIFGNSGWGLRSSGAESVIANDIFQSNISGDLEGVSNDSVLSSLVSDGQLEGVNDNLSGEAAFVDPGQDDFSLRADSPAIDRGTDLEGLSSLDLLSHQRVKDGDGDGTGQVDMGAVEFGSEYWSPRLLSILPAELDSFQGLGLVNASLQESRVLIKGYSRDGEPAVPLELPALAAGEQRTYLRDQLPGLPEEGWLELLSTSSDLIGVSFLGNSGLDFLGGAELCCAISDQLIFPEVSAGSGEGTQLFLMNPHTEAVEVVLRWILPAGPDRETNRSIPPKGMLSADLAELFGGEFSGYVTAVVPGGRDVAGMVTIGNRETRDILLALDYRGGGTELFVPHFSSVPGVESVLNLIAPETALQVKLEAFDVQGRVIDVVSLESLPAGEKLEASVAELFQLPPGPVTGWIRISSLDGRLLGSVRFSDPAGGMRASFPLLTEGARELIFPVTREEDGIFSALALLNPLSDETLVSIEILDGLGQQGGLSFLELSGGQRASGFLSHLVPESVASSGWIRVRATGPVVGLQVVGGEGFLSAISQQVVVP